MQFTTPSTIDSRNTNTGRALVVAFENLFLVGGIPLFL